MKISRIIIFFSTVSSVLSQSFDPCSHVATIFARGGVATTTEALSCLRYFPYNATLAKSVTQTLYKTFDLHVYKDISINSPTPEFPLKIDVMSGILEIEKTVYPSDYEFNRALHSLIQSLNDGHAAYFPYCYYLYLVSYTAFPLVNVINEGKQEIIISPAISLFSGAVFSRTEALLGISLSDYASAAVISIDGMNAFEFAVNFASGQGVYKDINARFNTAFSRYAGVSSLYYGGLSALPLISAPQKDNVTFVVQRVGSTVNETLVVPYLVEWEGSSFTNSSDYWTQFCQETSLLDITSQTPTGKRHIVAKLPHKTEVHRRAILANSPESGEFLHHVSSADLIKEVATSSKVSVSSSVTSRVVILVDSYVSTYYIPEKNTGIIVLPDFEGSGGDYSSWQKDVYEGITYLLSYGAKNLIIDVQDNGGGYAYLAYVLIEFLFPGVTYPQYPVQNPATPLIQKMAAKSNSLSDSTELWFSNPSQYNWAFDTSPYPNFTTFTSSKEYFFPLRTQEYAGVVSNYSSLYSFPDRLPSPFGLDELILPVADTTPLFNASNVIILSNGGCYSTCSLFAYVAQELLKVKVAAVGGVADLPMAYSAGTAGYSYSLSYLLTYDVGYLGFEGDESAPKSLPVQAYVGFTAAQAFCRENSTTPADFVFKEADYRFPFTKANAVSILTLYDQVAQLFSQH